MSALTLMAGEGPTGWADAAEGSANPEAARDIELVERAQAGDDLAFGELVDRHRRSVFRAAFAALRSAAESDDVAQETFVAAYQRLGTFRRDAAFKTWLLSIAWRKALDRRRSLARWLRGTIVPARSGRDTDLLEQLPATAQGQDDRLTAAELAQVVRRLVRSLPPKLRDPLLLAGSGDYSYDEISRMLGMPVGTIKWRVSEARRILKSKLAALGYTR